MAYFNLISTTVTRDDNETFTFSDTGGATSFGITELVGIEYPEVEVFTQPRGLGDGVFFTGQRFNGRTIEVHAKLASRAPSDLFTGRRAALNFFLADHTFEVSIAVINPLGGTVQRSLKECRLIAASYPTIDASDTNPDMVLQFMSPNPFFETAPTTVTFSNLAGGVHKTVTSTANVRSRFTVTLTCTSAGNGQNQIGVFWNGVGIAFGNVDSGGNPVNFTVGDVLEIDPETITVTFNGTDQFSGVYTDPNDVYASWFVNPGANDFYIDLFGKTPTFNVDITYAERYHGI